MAGVVSNEKSNSLNTELNLVPFIDLLSMLILFLLITAVWIQVASVPASATSQGKSSAATRPTEKLTVHVTDQGYQITWPRKSGTNKGALPVFIKKLPTGYDFEKLTATVKLASQADTNLSATVSGTDSVNYGEVVQVVDGLKTSGVLTVALSAN